MIAYSYATRFTHLYAPFLWNFTKDLRELHSSTKLTPVIKLKFVLTLFYHIDNSLPLSQEETDALQWYEALGSYGRNKLLKELDLKESELTWLHLLAAFRKVHRS